MEIYMCLHFKSHRIINWNRLMNIYLPYSGTRSKLNCWQSFTPAQLKPVYNFLPGNMLSNIFGCSHPLVGGYFKR